MRRTTLRVCARRRFRNRRDGMHCQLSNRVSCCNLCCARSAPAMAPCCAASRRFCTAVVRLRSLEWRSQRLRCARRASARSPVHVIVTFSNDRAHDVSLLRAHVQSCRACDGAPGTVALQSRRARAHQSLVDAQTAQRPLCCVWQLSCRKQTHAHATRIFAWSVCIDICRDFVLSSLRCGIIAQGLSQRDHHERST